MPHFNPKPKHGWTLLLGPLYNSGWKRASETRFSEVICPNCGSNETETHPLEKPIFTFFIKKIIYCCTNCLTEWTNDELQSRRRGTSNSKYQSNNLVKQQLKKFQLLPKELRERLLRETL